AYCCQWWLYYLSALTTIPPNLLFGHGFVVLSSSAIGLLHHKVLAVPATLNAKTTRASHGNHPRYKLQKAIVQSFACAPVARGFFAANHSFMFGFQHLKKATRPLYYARAEKLVPRCGVGAGF